MPTFDEFFATQAPTTASADISSELPALTDEDVPSLEALDALSLDLPPLPDFSDWTLDTTLALDLPSPIFSDLLGEGTADPALDELEQWLSAIVADRSPSQ